MPRYNYRCPKHGDFAEYRRVNKRKDAATCPQCGASAKYHPTFETQPPKFKGKGFYETDYVQKPKGPQNENSTK